MKLYVCGPITGYPEGNRPLFEHVASTLRNGGHAVVNPFDMDTQQEVADTLTKHYEAAYWHVLARDIQIVGSEIDAIVLLPGWDESVGARLEVSVGLLRKRPCQFFRWNGRGLDAMSHNTVRSQAWPSQENL